MSETYTVGGDTLAFVKNNLKSAQSFTPQETHILQWIDLDLKQWSEFLSPTLLLYEADSNHKPTGDYISRNGIGTPIGGQPAQTRRIRLKMQSVTLFAYKQYVMVLNIFPPLLGLGTYWLYDAGDATYPRGVRLSSDDTGASWTIHEGDDHIFAEFGEPPAPPPPPEPPISHFAILDVIQTLTPDGYLIMVTTNIPCHLYMYWTSTKPEKHTEPIIRRGEYFKDAVRYCFVTWDQNEQLEPGDTLYHTFLKEPWPECETRWFTFRAKVDDEWTPSVGPIFEKHRPKPAPTEHQFEIYSGIYLRNLNIFGYYWHANTFLPDKNYYLTKCGLWLAKGSDDPGSMYVCIHRTKDGHPIGTPLATKSMPINLLPVWPNGQWFDFLFSPGFLVLHNTLYAIVIHSNYPDVSGCPKGRYDSFLGESTGYKWSSLDSGQTWTIDPLVWIYYRLFGVPQP